MDMASGGGNILEFFNPNALPYVLMLVIAAVVGVRVVGRVTKNLAERLVAHRLMINNANTMLAFALYSTAAIVGVTSLFRLSSEALLALSGTIAVTVGLALKDVASAFLAGISILINKPFQVGDRVSFGGYYGEVVEIGLRTVRLVTLDGNLVTIPSNKFLTDPVASANAGVLDRMVLMRFYLAPNADHGRAKEIVHDAVLASRYLYLGKPFAVLVGNRLGDDARLVVELTAKAYVYDARHELAFSSDVTDRVLSRFRKENIPVPW